MGATTHPTAALHQAVAIQHRMDGALRGEGNIREPASQALANFTSTPAGVLALHIQDEVFHLEGKLFRVAIGAPASVGEPLNAAFLVTVEYLVTGLARDPK